MTVVDKLDSLRARAAEARDLELRIQDLETQIKDCTEQLLVLYHTTLPDLMDNAGTDIIGVPPSGNKPGIDYVMRPYYHAGIAASWDEVRKQQAFALLKQLKAESLIKTEITAKFPKGNLPAAKKLFASVKKLKITGAAVDLKQSVHTSTLTAWLRDIYDRGQTLGAADLEKIGGSVGRIVKPKDRKE